MPQCMYDDSGSNRSCHLLDDSEEDSGEQHRNTAVSELRREHPAQH